MSSLHNVNSVALRLFTSY